MKVEKFTDLIMVTDYSQGLEGITTSTPSGIQIKIENLQSDTRISSQIDFQGYNTKIELNFTQCNVNPQKFKEELLLGFSGKHSIPGIDFAEKENNNYLCRGDRRKAFPHLRYNILVWYNATQKCYSIDWKINEISTLLPLISPRFLTRTLLSKKITIYPIMNTGFLLKPEMPIFSEIALGIKELLDLHLPYLSLKKGSSLLTYKDSELRELIKTNITKLGTKNFLIIND